MWPRKVLMLSVVTVPVLVVTSLAGFGRQQASVVASGDIRITTAPDGLSALVSVDEENPDGPDGIVDRAFLVQTAKPMRVAFAGQATLLYTTTRLTITGMPGPTWAFPVAGKDAEPVPAIKGMTVIPAAGLSHYWGRFVDVTDEELAAKLLVRVCEMGALAGAGPGCDSCDAGGPGEPECEATCGDRTCSASCGDAYHACCSCDNGCRCCRDIEQQAIGSRAPAGRH